jgi:polar amino acid transport system substrate-binding protein
MKPQLRIVLLLAAMLSVFGILTAALAEPLSAAVSLGAPHRAAMQQTIPPPDSDWLRVQEAGVIVVGTSADYPPFEFYNSNFELDGFDIALMRALGERMGVTVAFNDFAFDGLLDALRLGQVDAAIGAVTITPDREQIVDFTVPYYLGDSAALARKEFTRTITSATQMAGLRIGVERGTTYHAWAQQNLVDQGVIAQTDLIPYGTTQPLLRDVRNGTVDLALLGLLPAEQAARQFGDLKIVAQGTNKQKFGVAARTDSSLIDELNTALLEVQADGTLAALVKQYLHVNPNQVIPEEEELQAGLEASPVVTETANAVTPVAQPCIDGMAYVADLNYDDQGMTAPPVMAPGQDFAKTWRVRNSGTCEWKPDYYLAYVSGNRAESGMGGAPVPVGRVVKPGETIDLTASLRAPQVPGVFQGFWKMHNSQGRDFGEVVWVGIQVPDPNPPAPPPPPPTQEINPNLRADADYINAGQCTTIRWDVDNVMAVYFIDGIYSQGVGGHDARTVCPTVTTTYTLRVVDMNGVTHDFYITINVGGGNNASYTMNFWADSTNIDQGQCTTLRWDVRNVREVYLNDEGVPGVSEREVCPSSTQTWVLRAVLMDYNQDFREVTVNVNNVAPPQRPAPAIVEFSVGNNSIPLGQCVTLRWRTNDVDYINLYRSGQTIVSGGPGNGEVSDCPPAVGIYDYTLDAYGNGYTTQWLSVEVFGPQPR